MPGARICQDIKSKKISVNLSDIFTYHVSVISPFTKINWFIDSFSQLCMDCCMSCRWHFNNRLLIRWCISQLQHFVSSASQKLSYRLSSSYSCFISFETSAPARAGLPGNDMPMTPPAQYLPIKSHSCAVNRGLINTDCSLGCVPSQ